MNSDRNLFLTLVCVLMGFGVLMVHSASVTSRPTEFEQIYLSRHVTHLMVGVIAASLCTLLPSRFWKESAPWLFAGTVVLLIAVLIPGIGTRVNDSQRWIRLGPFQMQPSELAKITLPLLLGAMLVKRQDNLRRWLAGTIPFVLPIAIVLPRSTRAACSISKARRVRIPGRVFPEQTGNNSAAPVASTTSWAWI